MSRLVADTGERVAVQVPTQWGTSARIDVQDADGRVLVSLTLTTYSQSEGLETKVIADSHSAIILPNTESVDATSGRVIFTRRAR